MLSSQPTVCVEEAWLIHRDTGILLCHAGEQTGKDPLVVSGMLQAMEALLTGAFDDNAEGIQQIRCGEFAVVFDRGKLAIVAVLVRGELIDPAVLGTSRIVRQIHEEYDSVLRSNVVDSQNFVPVSPLISRVFRSVSQKHRNVWPLLSCACAFAILLAFALPFFGKSETDRKFDKLVQHVQDGEPGYELVKSSRDDGKLFIALEKDVLARSFDDIKHEYGLAGVDITTTIGTEKQFLDPEIMVKRANLVLRPPATVRISVEGNRIVFYGHASSFWITHTRFCMKHWDRIVGDFRYLVETQDKKRSRTS